MVCSRKWPKTLRSHLPILKHVEILLNDYSLLRTELIENLKLERGNAKCYNKMVKMLWNFPEESIGQKVDNSAIFYLPGYSYIQQGWRNGFGSSNCVSEITLPRGTSLPLGLAFRKNPAQLTKWGWVRHSAKYYKCSSLSMASQMHLLLRKRELNCSLMKCRCMYTEATKRSFTKVKRIAYK